MTVRLTWTPGSSATSQTVQYKLTDATTWITAAVINNNTTSIYQFDIPDGSYKFRVLNSCVECLCSNGSQPDVEGQCMEQGTIPATGTGDVTLVTRTPYYPYGVSGTVVHHTLSPNVDFNGPWTRLNLDNLFWRRSLNAVDPVTGAVVTNNDFTNPTFDPVIKQRTDENNGPVNRLSIWGRFLSGSTVLNNYNSGTIQPTGQWIGFSICINIATTKTYYVAIAADNSYRFYLDDVLLLQDISGDSRTFSYLHIYPIDITAGDHILKLQGINNEQKAGFGCEVYDLGNVTPQQAAAFLETQTNYNNINVIFTTRGVTSFTSNLVYTCPSGYVLSNPNCQNATCFGDVINPCVNQPKSSNIVSAGSRRITDFYTPCALQSSIGNITASDVYLAAGVTNIAPGVQLYNVNNSPLIGITLIANSFGIIYNVNDSTGIVGTANGDSC